MIILGQSVWNDSGVITSIIWFTAIISGILIIIVLRYTKVKEGIGLTLEMRLTMLIIVSTFVLYHVSNHHQFLRLFMSYSLQIGIILWGTLPLYLTLYFIYKSEGTLNFKAIASNKRSLTLSNPNFVDNDNKSDHPKEMKH